MILKRDFAIANDLDEEKLTLIFDGARINPEETVNTLGIEDGDCIDVYMKWFYFQSTLLISRYVLIYVSYSCFITSPE